LLTVVKDELVKTISFLVVKSPGKAAISNKIFSDARPATKSEIEEDAEVSKLASTFDDGHYIAVLSNKLFPKNSTISGKIGPTVRNLTNVYDTVAEIERGTINVFFPICLQYFDLSRPYCVWLRSGVIPY
jgi:hypothetical protein